MSPENINEMQFKVAMLFPGDVSDQSWNTVGLNALLDASDKLEFDVDYSASVREDEYEDKFTHYASNHYNLIIGHGSEFGDAAKKIAAKFPFSYFAVINSDVRGKNLIGLDTKNEEMGYLAGYIAGLLSQTKVAAFVGAERIVAMMRAEQGFHLGVKTACPECEVLVQYIGSFDNQEMGRKTGLSLIERNADFIFNNDDEAGLAVMKVAEEKGILVIGSDYDQKSVAPRAIITCILTDVSSMIFSIIRCVKDGNVKPDQVFMNGFDNGFYCITPLDMTMVNQEQARKIMALQQQLFDGMIDLPHMKASTI